MKNSREGGHMPANYGCTCTDADSSGGCNVMEGSMRCTRPAGHSGPHHAHGKSGTCYKVW